MNEPEARHRLAAILAADAAGYSRVMAEDDRVALAALDAARAVFRKHIEAQGGRVIDTAGDSVLASFETATGAVRAAVAIQRKLSPSPHGQRNAARLSFRIGVHIGDVLEKADGSVYGDGVNIAARLQALCEPGGVMVSQAVHGAVASRIRGGFDDAGEQAMKNIPHPVRAFRLRAEGHSPTHRFGRHAVVPPLDEHGESSSESIPESRPAAAVPEPPGHLCVEESRTPASKRDPGDAQSRVASASLRAPTAVVGP
jgi:adenylate cyclase